MPKSREQLKQEYINSLDSFIAQNPKVGQLDTAKFRDFLIGLVEHESGFNPTAKQGSYFGWYQTNKLDADPYKQHMNAFNHLNGLFRETITKADVQKARELGIKDASLMLKYWNQGNRVNNYIWNGKDSADGLGTKISNYGNDLTMPLDVYSYAMDNLTGDYTIKPGDNWFNLQKRIRIPGRDYATGGKDLWDKYNKNKPFGLLKIGQKYTFGNRGYRPLPEDLMNAWKINPINAMKTYGKVIDYIGPAQVSHKPKYQHGGELVYKSFINSVLNDEDNDLFDFTFSDSQPSYPVEPVQIKTISEQTENVNQPIEAETVNQSNDGETVVKTPVIPAESDDFTERDLYILDNGGSNKDKRRVALKYLQKRLNLTKDQAAALVGIWQAESGFNLNAENKAEKAGRNSAVKSSQYGIGIGQWTGSRHDDYVNYTKGDNSLKNQLDFAANEIETKYQDFLNNLRSANNVKDATAYAYVQYVGGNEKNIKDITDLYSRVNRMVNRYRKKHLELYGKASNGFEQRLKFAIDSLNIS